MKARDVYRDDDGVEWELEYEQVLYREEDDPPDAPYRTRVVDFMFRQKGTSSGLWQRLPAFATVRNDAKITLCFFDEDDEGDLSFWDVSSAPKEVPA